MSPEYSKSYLLILFIILAICIILLITRNKKTEKYLKQKKIFILNTTSNQPAFPTKVFYGCDVFSYEPAKSSSNYTPLNWNHMGQIITDRYDRYDGFIVLHGRDNVAYSAAAISFMLENTSKPIIFTSSYKDLLNSVQLIRSKKIPDVLLCSRGAFYRGAKRRASAIAAMMKNGQVEVNPYNIPQQNDNELVFRPYKLDKRVIVIKVFPGIDSIHLHNSIKDSSVHAIILDGINHGPSNKSFLVKLVELMKRGILVIHVSNHFPIEMEQIGVISGEQMTLEGALAKTLFILSHTEGLSPEEVRNLFNLSMKGER